MEYTREKNITMVCVSHYICDRCRCVINIDDDIGIQEMLHWRNNCGYGSIFGDGSVIKIDLCQQCVKQLLGEYIQYLENDYD